MSGGAWSPTSLFAASEVGVWYDPSDLSTMFQDSAGTTPVTADGQTVGLILDKSAALTIGTEIIGSPLNGVASGAWAVSASGVTRNGSVTGQVSIDSLPIVAGETYKAVFDVAGMSGDSFFVKVGNTGGADTRIETNGTKTLLITALNSGKLTFIPWAGTAGEATITNISLKLIAGNHATQATAAKRPVYKTSGGLHWLQFDGVDDAMATGIIDFSATDEMSVFAGVRKTSDSAQRIIAELSATIASNNGSWALSAPVSAAANYDFSSKGTLAAANTVTTYTAPITNVITGLADISGDSNIIRVNGAQVGSVATDQGAGNYGSAYPLYIGGRAGTSLYLSGNIYSLIVRNKVSTTGEITSAESYVAGKTGLTL